jgi:preprotein translocase subunit SecA
MFKKIVRTIVGDPTQKYLDSLKPIIEEVASLEAELQMASDAELRQRSLELRARVEQGTEPEEILPEAFALVREASVRTTGLRHYDVQIMGGVLLYRGEVVEMKTGEGKTLVATLPLYLNALLDRGAHLVTVNEYLARRDGGWMGKIYDLLGLSVACIGPQQFSALYDPDYVNPGTELEDERLVHWRPCTRFEAYQADITYGISSEFGFDYLRDNMVKDPVDLVQRDLYYAIVDEADNVLIDEARTPLIISGPMDRASQDYVRFSKIVRGLKRNTNEEGEEPDGHYDIDEKSKSISLTDMGIAEIERRIDEIDADAGDSLYDPRFFHLTYFVDNALRAQYLFHKDKEYVVQNGEVIIVDDFTGRLMPGRRYSDGLHEAIEAKESVQVRRENATVATITLQNYFRLYEKLAGMTATAMTDAEEFHEIYELDVTPLPTNVDYIVEDGSMELQEQHRKVDGADETYWVKAGALEQRVFAKRIDFADQVYGTSDAKDQAIIDEIIRVNKSGRPILVGTTSVEHSETIHKLLRRKGIEHAVLNAKRHQSEALVVAQAGRKQAVTISTNMAGRGTDILLGGNAEGLAAQTLEYRLMSREDLGLLAGQLLSNGAEAARSYAERHPKLIPELVDALQELKDDLDEKQSKIEEDGLINFLARYFQESYQIDFTEARHVLRLIHSNRAAEAREFLNEQERDVAIAEDAGRLMELHNGYTMAKGDVHRAAVFLADNLFEKIYSARAALIRAVMNDEDEEAQKLVETIPSLPAEAIQWIKEIRANREKERQEVWRLGGLHVIGSERHESRRIDNQLRGRAARQGDPGSSRFFLSLEDELMLRFGGERLRGFMARTNIPEDMPIESGLLDRIIESSQERIEGYNFDIRKNVVEYDDVMSKQRQAIYGERRAILMSEDVDLDERVQGAFDRAVDKLVGDYLENYRDFMRAEIDRAVLNFSTDATDTINVYGVLVRMRGLLPGVATLDRADLADVSARELVDILMDLVDENLENGENLLQFIRAASRFIPLLPSVPNLAGILASQRSGQLALVRDKIQRDFVGQIEVIFNDFLVEYIDEAGRDALWKETSQRFNGIFERFRVEGLSRNAMLAQQADFRRQCDEGLRDMLKDSLFALDNDQLAESLAEYAHKQSDRWREQIGEEAHHEFQRILLLQAIDGEWRDYLVAMDDLRREIGLEAVAQRDPKVEYKRRSYQMFADMRSKIDETVVDNYFRRIGGHQAYIHQQEQAAQRQSELIRAGYQVVQREKGKGVELRRDAPKVGRNDPCPCGSGKKYKYCHMRSDQQAAKSGGRRSKAGAR